MSRRVESLALIVIGLLVFSVRAAQAQTPASPAADENAIKQLVRQLQDGWNAHDGKAFAAPFAADADYVIVNGIKIKGHEEIEKGHTEIFTTIYKGSHNVGTLKSIRFLRPDVAVAHVEWNLEYSMGAERKKTRAMNSLVVTKDNGKWSIAAFHNTLIQAEGR